LNDRASGKGKDFVIKVSTIRVVEPSMMDNGNKISKMVMGKRYGPIMLFLEVSIKMERNMEKENFYGRTIAVMKENSKIIILKDSESTHGKMEEDTKANGRTTKCKE